MPSPTISPANATSPDDAFLNVGALLEQSRPNPGALRYLALLPPIGLAAMLTALALMFLAPGRSAWWSAAALLSLIVSAAAMFAISKLAGLAKAERRQVAEADELIMLRHFGPAAAKLHVLLNAPMRLPQHRALALMGLVRVLGRAGRFDDAVEAADAVLADERIDPATRFAVGCGRAMALLRADRLYDAGDAIAKLRREVGRIDSALRASALSADEARETTDAAPDEDAAPEEAETYEDPGAPATRVPFDSGALTLVELYRDVQTRHNAEAIATYETKRLALREALGIRVADAMALAALASHRMGDAGKAGTLWSDATALVPDYELRRRYPELAEVASAHPATRWPGAAIGGAA